MGSTVGPPNPQVPPTDPEGRLYLPRGSHGFRRGHTQGCLQQFCLWPRSIGDLVGVIPGEVKR